MTTPPPWMLRRFAVRALCVLERHEGKLLRHDSVLRTLPPSAEAYVVAYARTAEERDELVGITKDLRRGVADMQRMLAAYATVLEQRLPQFRAADHVDRYADADEAVRAAKGVLHLLAAAQASARPGDDSMWPELEQALAHAVRVLELAAAENAAATQRYHAAQTRLRVLGDVLHSEVEAFRLRLRAILGPGHADYRKLGIDGAWLDDEDDDPIASETVADDLAALDLDMGLGRAS
ncbi:MAG: hypothetical protein B7733_07855 [Myxococcales bacterium FL481]|nr:MAG: hypothetical protein B7733_07855 [Myxococcales bacterium FL481]